LIELLLQQPGIGEMQLLRPALKALTRTQRVALVQPPHLPQIAAWSWWGLPSERLLWVKTSRTADALWTAEQILRNGSCGALLLWQTLVRAEALRRLHLAAQSSETVFWMLRPLASVEDASPSPLRMGLRPARGGIDVDILKRRGPQSAAPVFVKLDDMPTATSPEPTEMPTQLIVNSLNHALLDRRALAAATS
jgi:protein ImuA